MTHATLPKRAGMLESIVLESYAYRSEMDTVITPEVRSIFPR